jgi:hypothetical protein
MLVINVKDVANVIGVLAAKLDAQEGRITVHHVSYARNVTSAHGVKRVIILSEPVEMANVIGAVNVLDVASAR